MIAKRHNKAVLFNTALASRDKPQAIIEYIISYVN